jgi:co-chaperonin GroES (HSP10)
MGLNYEIFGNRCLIELIEEAEEEVSEKSEGGIFLPTEVVEKEKRKRSNLYGKVKLVGGDVNLVSTGDTIMYNRGHASPIFLDGKEYFLIKEDNIIGKEK